MANRRKGRRKIWVDGELYVWEVRDGSDDEAIWCLAVTADNDWQKQFYYPLTEVNLRQLATDPNAPPLPEEFDKETMTLRNAVTSQKHGGGRHIPATPKLVRTLIEWYVANAWQVDPKSRSEPTG